MYLDKNFILKSNFLLIIYSLFITILIFLLNEIVYYEKNLSTFINIIISIIIIIIYFRNKLYAIFSILFITLLINTRPRELHLVDLLDRGNFDYYSINIQKIGPFVISTSLIIIFIFLSIFSLLFRNKILIKPLKYIILYTLIGLISMYFFLLIQGDINLNKIMQDFRFVFLFIGGFLIIHEINLNYDIREITYKFINFIIFCFFINIILTLFNFFYDFSQNYFKLQYSINTLNILFVFFFLITLRKYKIYFNILFIITFFLLIPFTRGEQLNYLILILISIVVLIYQKNYKINFQFIIYIIIISFVIINSIIYIQYNFESSYNYFISKISFFIEGSSTDHSSSMRINELVAIVNFDYFYDYYKLLFGHGFGGYYVFDHTLLRKLNFADYSPEEIINNQFYQPHMFLTYFLLKTGIVGTIFIVYIFISNLNFRIDLDKYREAALMNRLYIFVFFSLIYNSYWMPQIAFLSGFIISILIKINNKKDIND